MAASNTTVTKSSHRKRSSKSSHHRDKHSGTKRKKDSHSKDEQRQNKYKTLAQLAKLVQSGKLKVPCSLVEYVDDHASLIDQIFTILTIDDIEGMLPDILKGLKLKKIKHLCYMQLNDIPSSELRQIIAQEVIEDDSKERGPNEVPLVINDISNDEMEESGSTTTVSHVGVAKEDEIEVNVLSDEALTCDNNKARNHENDQPMEDNKSVTKTKKHKKTESEKPGAVKSRWRRVEKDQQETNEEREDDEDGGSWEGSEEKRWKKDVPDDARLLEMRLREKLLEAQVRRLADREAQRKKEQEEKQEEKEVTVSGSCSDGGESDEGEPGEMVELDLRHRALQSLLVKRREKLKSNS